MSITYMCELYTGGHGGIKHYKRFADLSKIKKWHFEIFANTGPYRAGNFKPLLLLQFIRCERNFTINKAVIRDREVLNILSKIKKKNWHFEILTWESMGNS